MTRYQIPGWPDYEAEIQQYRVDVYKGERQLKPFLTGKHLTYYVRNGDSNTKLSMVRIAALCLRGYPPRGNYRPHAFSDDYTQARWIPARLYARINMVHAVRPETYWSIADAYHREKQKRTVGDLLRTIAKQHGVSSATVANIARAEGLR